MKSYTATNNASHYVRDFHLKFRHPVREIPTLLSHDETTLRIKLMAEELSEYCQAVGVKLQLETDSKSISIGVAHDPEATVSMVGAADALTDLMWVTAGSMLCHGFPEEELFVEVYDSNMSKLGANDKPIFRDDGKILKGPHFFEPDIKTVLLYAGATAEELS